ncbi:unnamed protein product [Rotaria magnacalcarata]|uniref:SGNH hydrolase-type esterase domain-containing protein n=2 Tax=Rotaria magnacalcarata TaxID=392030 RepID=A0A820C3R3_9BILA|nr:unnamed protein product [Rotaria magnacalcarata]CAF4217482.1 unnamed protein product [Rotaria magnacalcarata]
MNYLPFGKQSVLILSDSHGRCFEPTTITPYYCVKTYSISGLQWINKFDKKLCLFSLIQQDPYPSLINSTSYILFIVGTNSVRTLPATEVINQLDHILEILYSQYVHLSNGKIIITTCIPCLKPSKRFPTISLLKNNIDNYNQLLLTLSRKHKFFYLDLQVTIDWLGYDLIHIHYKYRHHFSNLILHYIDSLNVNQRLNDNVQYRSQEAIARRNKIRNQKLKHIQQFFTLAREVHPVWSYAHLKHFLKLNGLRFGSISINSHNRLQIRFNHCMDMTYVDQALPVNIFDWKNFHQWFQ